MGKVGSKQKYFELVSQQKIILVRFSILLVHHPNIQVLGTVHAQRNGQLNICGAAWVSDKDKVVTIFGFSKNLMHIRPQSSMFPASMSSSLS